MYMYLHNVCIYMYLIRYCLALASQAAVLDF